jgi:2-polyprenyl-3-methyl-5-hydroxy-6-metoxy-1,4-benzoquinol methylase
VLAKLDDIILQWGRKPIVETMIYETALMMREYAGDLDMRTTPYYRWLCEQIKTHTVWGYISTEADVVKRCETYRDLYKDIKTNGCRSLINVYICNDGKILVLDGSHRCAILKALGERYVGCEVGMASVKWKDLMKPDQVRGYSDTWAQLVYLLKNQGDGMLYSEVDHPFFDGWPVWRSSKPRFGAIAANLAPGQRVVDIGCFTGYMVHHLRMMHVQADGVDLNRQAIAAARMLSDIYGVRARFTEQDGLDYLTANTSIRYDAALCLSALHHMERGKSLDYVKKLLSMTPDTLFLEVVKDGEPIAKGLTITSKTVQDWLKKNTKYANVRVIQTDLIQGRPLLMCKKG